MNHTAFTRANIRAMAGYVPGEQPQDGGRPHPVPVRGANLTFVASPNSPSGTCVSVDELARLADSLEGVLVIDEAYVDFAEHHCLELARRSNVVVTRSLSKSYALAGV